MKEPIVVDSTCLISLERIGCLDILSALFEPILIPPEVQREFGTALPWLTVAAPADQSLVAALKMLIDDGEAEAIALAHERGQQIILDDRRARKTLLDELEAHAFYISDALKNEALHQALIPLRTTAAMPVHPQAFPGSS